MARRRRWRTAKEAGERYSDGWVYHYTYKISRAEPPPELLELAEKLTEESAEQG
jgi:hypothetical protein